MRRDCVTQIIVDWGGGEWENFATPFEAEQFINAMLDELDVPKAAWREDMQGNKKWDYEIIEDDNGLIKLVD
jgi:hypothetical protein